MSKTDRTDGDKQARHTGDNQMTNQMSYIPFNDGYPSDSPCLRRIGHLPTGETISLPLNTPAYISHNSISYVYAGTSDGIAYYHLAPKFLQFEPEEIDSLWCKNCFQHKCAHSSNGECA